MKEITAILLENNIKPSYPRLHIYNYLKEFKNHPTVDDIYSSVIDTIPTLSKTTVYNTLKLFEDHKLVKGISLDDNEKHYELVLDKHSHFQCEVCRTIYDIPYSDIDLLPNGYKDFKVNKTDIFLKGICPNCR